MAIPKYQYIKDELKNKIISGQFASGDKFFTEAELIAMYDVSSITVVRALNDLAKDGYIVRQQGKGTFVARSPAQTRRIFWCRNFWNQGTIKSLFFPLNAVTILTT